ncbi:hypothetical protein [Nocardioides sp. J54]|uniref:hypothetical protein n=1 Tax=Nocardioides sp. J54 TaxID=935866 RepID=UPI00048F365C|nr:hypothetical protein [Nocardioides sp. J54]
MAEQLSDLLHGCADTVDVPHPDATAIAARGRTMRTRRRAGTVVAAALVVGALGLGGVVLGNALDGEARSSQVAQRGEEDPGSAAADEYAERSAWSAGSGVTIGTTTVDLGSPVAHLAQTSSGVVARLFQGDAGNSFVLVRPDGATVELGIPSSVVHVEGDLAHPRVAWLEVEGETMVAHVWDVDEDREVGRASQPAQEPGGLSGLLGGEAIPVPRLDGDDVYFSVDNDVHFRVDWANGGATALPYAVHSVHDGIATALDDAGAEDGEWLVYDVDADRVLRRLGSDSIDAVVSPDGRQVLTLGQTDEGSAIGALVPVAGGDPVPLAGVGLVSTWAHDGHVVSLDGETSALVRCDAAGTCEREQVTAPDRAQVLLADQLVVG